MEGNRLEVPSAANNRRRMTTPAIMVPAGFGQNDTHVDAALERIFHPEQFSVEEKSENENVDGNKRLNSKRKSSVGSIVHIHGLSGSDTQAKSINKMVERMFGKNAGASVSDLQQLVPRSLFVQMSELEGDEWVEEARWIKYEEVRERGSERWGKAHISTLTFHSLINLRLCLESGIMMLDLEANDLPGVAYSIVEELFSEGIIEDKQRAEVLSVLLYRHKCVIDKSFNLIGMRRNISQRSFRQAFSSSVNPKSPTSDGDMSSPSKKAQFGIDMPPEEMGRQHRSGSVMAATALASKRDSIMNCLKEGTEGAITMVGSLKSLTHPVVAFVRLAEGVVMPNVLEVLVPVRFVFVLLTPQNSPNMDCHEVGRSFSTLMSNPTFQASCYRIEERGEVLSSINEFLDESVVLPPGDFESKALLSINEIQDLRKRRQEHKEKKRALEEHKLASNNMAEEEEDKDKAVKTGAGGEDAGKDGEDGDGEKKNVILGDPLVRTGRPFGGVINDFKRRMPHYWSDIKDGCSMQVLSTGLFIYFACLAPAIAFGGLYGDKTENFIGIPVTLLVCCVAGIAFSLFAGNPLVITGVTGPILLFDEALFNFSKSSGVEFLPWRVWTSLWMFLIALVVAGFEGSVFVKYFTKFTKDIFATLIAVIYIFEAIKKLAHVFEEHPMATLEVYCHPSIETALHNINNSLYSHYDGKTFHVSSEGELFGNFTSAEQHSPAEEESKDMPHHPVPTPNAALLSFILMMSTFIIAYYLKIFRNGKFLGRTVRRALGDFGVPIAIVVMVVADYLMDDQYTQKLIVPSGLQLTAPEKRGWIISPMGIKENIPAWAPFAAIIPAALLYLLLFMETEICELLMLEKATKKGGGLHWDIVLMCLVNVFCGVIGGPWICAATVRAISHVSALTIMSTTHAPGEQPKIVDVLDQRLSGLFVGVMLGISVLLGPVLKLIPYSVLFGVFIYMGVSAIFGGIQMFDRFFLLFKPVKYHPQVSYVRRVKTWKMHMFTGFQFFGLAVLWTVKSINAIALFFPFFVVAMIPLRMSLKYLFTPKELNALDGPKAGQTIKDDEPDFYDQAYA